jgi:hypothetical protein
MCNVADTTGGYLDFFPTKFDGKNAYNKQSPGRRPGEYDSPNIEK